MLKLGDVRVDPPLFLAPMAGVTDRDFRLIVRRIGGVGVVTMEFISSKGLMRGERRVRKLLHFSEEERPISIQIYGSDPDTMAEAAREVEERGADVCDVNMGCPANKILKGCAGARLRRRIAELKEILSIPVIGNGDVATADDAVRRGTRGATASRVNDRSTPRTR